MLGPGLKWNFAKFLCDENGIPFKRYAPNQSPLSFENDIQDILGNN
jgi:glutathione peroxidase